MQEIEETTPKSNKDEALKIIKEVKEETTSYRKQFEKQWREAEDFYYGKQHKTGEQHKTVKNYVFKVVEGEVPILTDSMPGTTINSIRPDRQDDAKLLEGSIKHVYQDQNLPLILPTLVRSSLISAPGFLYPYYDPDADWGDGKIRYKKLPWESISLDGNAQTLEDATRARIEIPMRLDEIIRMFPEHEEELKKDAAPENKDKSNGQKDSFETRDVSGWKSSPGRPQKADAKDIYKYVETWKKSYDLEPIPDEETAEELSMEQAQLAKGEPPDAKRWQNHDAHIKAHAELEAQVLAQLGLPPGTEMDDIKEQLEQVMQQNEQASALILQLKIIQNHKEEHEELKKLNKNGMRPKYKDGWRLIKSVKDVILYDGPNPEQSGEIMLVPFYCYKDDTIYGFSEAKNILDPQKTLNEMDYKEYLGLKRTANPGWIADHESGLKPENLTNEDGIVVLKAKGTEARRLEPGAISPQLAARRESDAFAMEDISGINEATQGRSPSPSSSGAAITSLQNQAIGRVRLKDRYLQHYSMKRLAKLTAVLIINNWTTEKRMRLNTDDGSFQELIYDPLKMQDLEYQVEIAPGSMAGIDKEALNAFYLRLLEGQKITPQAFFQVVDIPKKELLLKQLNLEQEQAAQVQAMQQEAQAQVEQVSGEALQLQKDNLKLRATIDPRLLSKEELKALLELTRQEAIAQITGNEGATNGQPEINQGQ